MPRVDRIYSSRQFHDHLITTGIQNLELGTARLLSLAFKH